MRSPNPCSRPWPFCAALKQIELPDDGGTSRQKQACGRFRMVKKIAVTGATGFIGRHVLKALSKRPVEVVALSRQASGLPQFTNVSWRRLDIAAPPADPHETMGRPDTLIHLAWDGLPNYRSLHHFETELPRQYAFLERAVECGLPSLFCAGTCFEYGMQTGALAESSPCVPDNPYGFAKHALQQQLSFLERSMPFSLTWARLFYTYGPGQNPRSLWTQFHDAYRKGHSSFDMSGGKQVRDFLAIEKLAQSIADLALGPGGHGVVNLCSGTPVTVLDLVQGWAAELAWDVRLNLGHYPYPDYEPMEFWGDDTLLRKALLAS
jgi:nucleoside-diphosphate-sugar epimerase